MTITAKFDSKCPTCQGPIVAGEQVEWSKGTRARHQGCPAPQVAAPAQGAGTYNGRPLSTEAGTASAKQLSFLTSLVQEREPGTGVPDNLSEADASAMIERVKALPAPEKPGPDVVPAARYALVEAGQDEPAFYRVWRGSRKPEFVKIYSDDTGEELPYGETMRILRLVAEDSWGAARLYGKLRCKCSRCGLKLKNRISVYLAIGPTCIKYWHAPDACSAMRAEARAAIEAEGFDPNELIDSNDNQEA